MTRRRQLANDNPGRIVLASLPCHDCRRPIAERVGSIYAVAGTALLAWCSPACAARSGLPPWSGADLQCRAVWPAMEAR